MLIKNNHGYIFLIFLNKYCKNYIIYNFNLVETNENVLFIIYNLSIFKEKNYLKIVWVTLNKILEKSL